MPDITPNIDPGQQNTGASDASPDAAGSGATGADWTHPSAVDAPRDSGTGGIASGTGGLTASDTADQADELNNELLGEE